MKLQATKVIEAENIKALAQIRAEKIQTETIKQAESYKAEQEALADNESKIIKEQAQTRLQVAKLKCEALIKESQAETTNSEHMQGMRSHTEKMALQDELEQLTSNGKVVLSGQQGEKILDYYTNTITEIQEQR